MRILAERSPVETIVLRFDAIWSRYFEYSRLKTRVRSSSKALSKFLSCDF